MNEIHQNTEIKLQDMGFCPVCGNESCEHRKEAGQESGLDTGLTFFDLLNKFSAVDLTGLVKNWAIEKTKTGIKRKPKNLEGEAWDHLHKKCGQELAEKIKKSLRELEGNKDLNAQIDYVDKLKLTIIRKKDGNFILKIEGKMEEEKEDEIEKIEKEQPKLSEELIDEFAKESDEEKRVKEAEQDFEEEKPDQGGAGLYNLEHEERQKKIDPGKHGEDSSQLSDDVNTNQAKAA